MKKNSSSSIVRIETKEISKWNMVNGKKYFQLMEATFLSVLAPENA